MRFVLETGSEFNIGRLRIQPDWHRQQQYKKVHEPRRKIQHPGGHQEVHGFRRTGISSQPCSGAGRDSDRRRGKMAAAHRNPYPRKQIGKWSDQREKRYRPCGNQAPKADAGGEQQQIPARITRAERWRPGRPFLTFPA